MILSKECPLCIYSIILSKGCPLYIYSMINKGCPFYTYSIILGEDIRMSSLYLLYNSY